MIPLNVNLDLARAYDYFGLNVDRERREHHDYLRLLLEFAAFLARLEAVGSGLGDAVRVGRARNVCLIAVLPEVPEAADLGSSIGSSVSASTTVT